jgi:hypothetical protein
MFVQQATHPFPSWINPTIILGIVQSCHNNAKLRHRSKNQQTVSNPSVESDQTLRRKEGGEMRTFIGRA